MDITTDARLIRHVVVTVLLAAAAVVVAGQVLLSSPDVGVNRYTPVRVSGTGNGGPAVQTGDWPVTRVVSTHRDPPLSGVPNAQ